MPNLNSTVLNKGGADRVVLLENYHGPYYSFIAAPYSTYTSVTRNSVNTPLFHTDKKPNPLPFNPFSYSLRSLEMWNGYYTRDSVYPQSPPQTNYLHEVGFRDQGPTGIVLPFSGTQQAVARESVNTKLLSKVKNQKINLAQAFGERHQAVRMFEGTAKRVITCITSLRKGNFVGAAKALGVAPKRRMTKRFERTFGPQISEQMSRKLRRKEQSALVADGWLALQYGWLPLFKDLHGAVESIADSQLPPKAFMTVRARTKLESGLGHLSAGIKTIAGQARYEVSSVVRFSATGAPMTRPFTSLGITNPVAVAWELMPFSFVVDWFLPIGKFLETLDATNGVVFEGGAQTIYQLIDGTASISQNVNTPGARGSYVKVSQYWVSKEKFVYVNRNKLNSFPTPILPSLKNPFSATHAANSMALLHKLFRK